MKSLSSLLLIAASVVLVSCETTGDPNQGGLFQWSQAKANDRIEVRERHLDNVEADTDYQRRRSESLEARQDRKERELYRERQSAQ